MQAWIGVMAVVVAVALVLTVYGALHDRTVNRRRAAEMLGPPQRDIPHLPAEARPPAYVTQAQAHRRPTGATRATRPASTLGEPSGDDVEIAAGYASADFVTEPGSREAVFSDPLVLVCGDAVETLRELLPALEQAIRTGRPLVVVAPAIAPEVLATLEVNAIQGHVPGVAVLADEAARAQVLQASGGELVDATDRRSGWLSPDALGHVLRWTSTRTTSRLAPDTRVGAPRSGAPE